MHLSSDALAPKTRAVVPVMCCQDYDSHEGHMWPACRVRRLLRPLVHNGLDSVSALQPGAATTITENNEGCQRPPRGPPPQRCCRRQD